MLLGLGCPQEVFALGLHSLCPPQIRDLGTVGLLLLMLAHQSTVHGRIEEVAQAFGAYVETHFGDLWLSSS